MAKKSKKASVSSSPFSVTIGPGVTSIPGSGPAFDAFMDRIKGIVDASEEKEEKTLKAKKGKKAKKDKLTADAVFSAPVQSDESFMERMRSLSDDGKVTIVVNGEKIEYLMPGTVADASAGFSTDDAVSDAFNFGSLNKSSDKKEDGKKKEKKAKKAKKEKKAKEDVSEEVNFADMSEFEKTIHLMQAAEAFRQNNTAPELPFAFPVMVNVDDETGVASFVSPHDVEDASDEELLEMGLPVEALAAFREYVATEETTDIVSSAGVDSDEETNLVSPEGQESNVAIVQSDGAYRFKTLKDKEEALAHREQLEGELREYFASKYKSTDEDREKLVQAMFEIRTAEEPAIIPKDEDLSIYGRPVSEIKDDEYGDFYKANEDNLPDWFGDKSFKN